LGKAARVRQLRELKRKERVDCVGLQETIKQNFTVQDLAKFCPEGGLCGTGFLQWAIWGDYDGGERRQI
jgi:hypothetical protein